MSLANTRIPFFVNSLLEAPHLLTGIAILIMFGRANILTNVLFYFVTADIIRKYFSSPVPLPKEATSKWKMVIVGAGPSGLCMAKRLLDVGMDNFVILEKSQAVGGVWHDNRFPGLSCDVPAHFYSYSFYLNPFWSRAYATRDELYQYFNNFATHFGLLKYVKFGVEVTAANWDKRTKQWHISTKEGKELCATFFVRATGPLHFPSETMLKNEESFSKQIMHSRLWDPNVKLEGKRVAIIGTGASAVQIVPAIADSVKYLNVFQRTPAWAPKRGDFQISDLMQAMFSGIPWTMQIYRYSLFVVREIFYHTLFSMNSPLHTLSEFLVLRDMKEAIGDDKELAAKLIPKYDVGCKRITVTDSYLQAFKKPNVDLITDPIDEFTIEGVRTKNGIEHKVDVIIKATGYDLMANLWTLPTYGTDGNYSHAEKVKADVPRAYLGVTVPEFPNMFFTIGPNSGLAHSSIIFVIETQVNYIIECMRTLAEANKSAMEVKKRRFEDHVEYIKYHMDNKSFASSTCSSYYKNSAGINFGVWPKDLITYWLSAYHCHSDDYDMA